MSDQKTATDGSLLTFVSSQIMSFSTVSQTIRLQMARYRALLWELEHGVISAEVFVMSSLEIIANLKREPIGRQLINSYQLMLGKS